MTVEPLAYTLQTAAEATGLSVDVIRRAVNSGNLASSRPVITNKKTGVTKKIARDLILRSELERWIANRAA